MYIHTQKDIHIFRSEAPRSVTLSVSPTVLLFLFNFSLSVVLTLQPETFLCQLYKILLEGAFYILLKKNSKSTLLGLIIVLFRGWPSLHSVEYNNNISATLHPGFRNLDLLHKWDKFLSHLLFQI